MPSRKIIIPLILTALLGGGWWFFADNKNQLPIKYATTKTTGDTWNTLSSDSDGDSLKDWEELLWKTDPKNPDTDGDGTTDNAEITANRDPLKAGPDDEMTAIPSAGDTGTRGTVNTESNLTAELAQDFMKSYLTHKLASSNDPALLNTEVLTAEALMNIQATLAKNASENMTDNFSENDIHVGVDDTKKTIRAYINTVGTLILAQNKKESKGVYITTMEALNNNNATSLHSLKETALSFAVLSEKLRTDITPPPSLVATHLRFINSFSHFGEITNKIADFETDPLGGMAALIQYKQESIRSLEALATITDTIHTYALTFSDNEGGAVFKQYMPYRKTGS
ncbi:MAG: hypothetical protein A3J55_03475 [Candidatus Ryanbacteria bacterium RIFCSPHIGHO2_02_FULL_45_17b]|uniref:Uncharacterized protein n=1 Tax=Candidatus Ryanbacteria bacterium RIFCSPHIGHO2_01_FULL_45_22 TaxID=1802114 RepID=A0A1G2G343_9BACT|nr:MAG: hypothetical protein A2719_04680 [Candidatus Ryanbacteria bacterium RIFCSPHIGHO2_01_FULL_45_22]OGZ47521.1 MAG: hypothetical protein A3J55_03475 [Candidatus Ryanbacteria bacterium RIFCSPHIGHO2_02_FULL_45_17b]